MPIPTPSGKEKEGDFVSRCMSEIGGEYDDPQQAVAICYSTYRKSKGMSMSEVVNSKFNQIAHLEKYKGIKNLAGLEDACWDGYIAIGTKELDGKTVPNCVPEKEEMAKIPIEIIGDNEEKILEYLPDVKSGESEDTYLERCVVVLYPEYVDEQAAYSICADKFQRIITKSDTGKTE